VFVFTHLGFIYLSSDARCLGKCEKELGCKSQALLHLKLGEDPDMTEGGIQMFTEAAKV